MAKKPEANPATLAVQRYRARQAKSGSKTLYCTVGKSAATALDSIMMRRICSQREAVEAALQRYAVELSRKR